VHLRLCLAAGCMFNMQAMKLARIRVAELKLERRMNPGKPNSFSRVSTSCLPKAVALIGLSPGFLRKRFRVRKRTYTVPFRGAVPCPVSDLHRLKRSCVHSGAYEPVKGRHPLQPRRETRMSGSAAALMTINARLVDCAFRRLKGAGMHRSRDYR